MKYDWIVAHYEAMNKGGQSQSRTHEAGLWGNTQFGPNATSNPEQWRVVPSNHRASVDLSVLIDSGIECEFWNEYYIDDHRTLAYLTSLEVANFIGEECYVGFTGDDAVYTCCQPKLNHWFSFRNFDNLNEVISAMSRAGFAITVDDESYAFQITGLQEGHCWPWEQDERFRS
jgi:hypothetical protein